MARIAFITCLSSVEGALGVEKRMAQQAAAARNLSLPMDFVYVNRGRKLASGDVRFVPIRPSDGPPSLWRYGALARHLDLDRYDALVLRWSGGDFSAFSAFFRENARRMVTEHHTKEEEEILSRGGPASRRMARFGLERILGRRMLRSVAGIVGVTGEIAEYEKARSGSRAPAIFITNGIATRAIPAVDYRPFDGKNLCILFPAAHFSAWHGLDRVVESLLAFDPGPLNVTLMIAGLVPEAMLPVVDRLRGKKGVNVELPGMVQGRDFDALCDRAQVGLSSMAMHRVGLKEACVLKTRDFAARGLPFVLAYDDPDFRGDLDFLFRVPSEEKPMDFSRLVEFLQTRCATPDVTERMRAFAAQNLDWDAKVARLYEFTLQAAGKE